jgi:hypothetical protein
MLAFGIKAGQLGARWRAIGYLTAVISIACKPTCREVERQVPYWCAAEPPALTWATGQSGSGGRAIVGAVRHSWPPAHAVRTIQGVAEEPQSAIASFIASMA